MNNTPTDAHHDSNHRNDLCSVSHRGGRTVITVRSETASLRPLRRLVDDRLESLVEAGRRSEYLVAVNEAVTNAIQSHQRNGIADPVTVTIDTARHRVVIDDRGTSGGSSSRAGRLVPADELRLDRELPTAAVHHGRGLRIIRTICPDAVVRQTSDGISVELPWD